MRRIISLFLCAVFLFTFTTPAFAATVEIKSTETFATSDTGYIEITSWTESVQRGSAQIAAASNEITYNFEIKQYELNELTQKVTSDLNNGKLIVTNYTDGIPVSTEFIYIADRVKRTKISADTEVASTTATTTSVGTAIGHISYKTTSYGTNERLRVHSKFNRSDTESYTINGRATDTIAIIIGLLVGAFTTWLTKKEDISYQIAVGIITGLGGSVAGGAIGITFSEDVAVTASYYTLTGYDISTGRYTQGFEGISRYVVTQSSSYYRQYFYDGYTPNNWKDSGFAYMLWSQLFAGDYYPGVSSYT